MNFHFIHVELSSRVLELINEFLWNSNEVIDVILDSFNHFKAEKSFSYRFEPFLKIIRESGNIIFIENVIAFLNALINFSQNSEERAILKSELIGCGIKNDFMVFFFLLKINILKFIFILCVI